VNPGDVIKALESGMTAIEGLYSKGVGPGPWEQNTVWQDLREARRQMVDFYGARPDWAASDPFLHEALEAVHD